MRYDKSNVECYNCHKLGHYAWECNDEKVHVDEQINVVNKQEDEEPTLLFTLKDDEKNEESSWYLDNGASNHKYGDKLKFASIDEKVQGNVSFGDSSKIQICGKGTILISSRNGSHRLIHDVYYVPKLKSNILSLGQILEKGYEVNMKNRCLWLRDQSENLIAKVYMSKNRIFLLNLKTIEVKCLKVDVRDEAWR